MADGDAPRLQEEVGVLAAVAGLALPEMVHGDLLVVERRGIRHRRRRAGGHLHPVRRVVERSGQDDPRAHRRKDVQSFEVMDPHGTFVGGTLEERNHLVHDRVHAVAHPEMPAPRQLLHVLRHREAHPHPVVPLQRGVRPGELHRPGVAENDAEERLAPVFESSQAEGLDGSGGRNRQREHERGGERGAAFVHAGGGVCQPASPGVRDGGPAPGPSPRSSPSGPA